MPDPPSTARPLETLQSLIDRPADQRLREYRYRFAQGCVFGLPVIALHLWGHRLGGPEAARWAALFQLLLAGWVIYVAAAGMLFEGAVRAVGGKVSADGAVALLAIGLYLASVASVIGLLGRPPLFHLSVILVTAWSGLRWALGRLRS